MLISGPVYMVVFAVLGFVYGVLNARSRIDKAVTERSERLRGELYTINQLIAMRTRVGGGVVDAIIGPKGNSVSGDDTDRKSVV